jgi:hypothetical protein
VVGAAGAAAVQEAVVGTVVGMAVEALVLITAGVAAVAWVVMAPKASVAAGITGGGASATRAARSPVGRGLR